MERNRPETTTFGVMIAGSGCLVHVEDESSGEQQVQRLGFFTTRFVVASSVDDAAVKAISIVADELESIVVNGANEPYRLEVEQVDEYLGERDVGGGFTWYPNVE